MKKEITLTKQQFSNLVAIYCFGIMSIPMNPAPANEMVKLAASMLVINNFQSMTDVFEKMQSLIEDIKDKEGMITISCDKLEVKL